MPTANHRGDRRIDGATRPGRSRLIQAAIVSQLALPTAQRCGVLLVDLDGAVCAAVLAALAVRDRKLSTSKVSEPRGAADKRMRPFQGGSDG